MTRVDRLLFSNGHDDTHAPLPLMGQKLQIHTDWRRDEE